MPADLQSDSELRVPVRVGPAGQLSCRMTGQLKVGSLRPRVAACQWLGLSETGAILRQRLSLRHSDHQWHCISKPLASRPVSEFTTHWAAVGGGRRRIASRSGLKTVHIFFFRSGINASVLLQLIFFWILVTPLPPSVDPYWIDFQKMWLRDEFCAIEETVFVRIGPIDFIRLNQCSTFDRCYAESLVQSKGWSYFVHTLIWYLWLLCGWIVLCSCSTHCGDSPGRPWN